MPHRFRASTQALQTDGFPNNSLVDETFPYQTRQPPYTERSV